LGQSKIKHQGFTVVEAIVAVALVAMLVLLVSGMMSNYLSLESQAEALHDLNYFHKDMKLYLGELSVCTNTFAPPINIAVNPSIANIKNANNVNIFSVGNWYSNNTINITGIKVQNYTNVSATLKRFEVEISYQSSRRIFDGSALKKLVYLNAVYAGGVFQNCYSDVGLAIDGIYLHTVAVADERVGDLIVKGDVTATSAVAADNYLQGSDRRLKENIAPLQVAKASFDVSGYQYKMKNSGQETYGVIAREVENLNPYLVSEMNNGFKAVKYTSLVPYFIEKIKMQKSDGQSVAKAVDHLDKKMSQLDIYLCQIKKRAEFCY
jgi:hypothetical protein